MPTATGFILTTLLRVPYLTSLWCDRDDHHDCLFSSTVFFLFKQSQHGQVQNFWNKRIQAKPQMKPAAYYIKYLPYITSLKGKSILLYVSSLSLAVYLVELCFDWVSHVFGFSVVYHKQCESVKQCSFTPRVSTKVYV